MELLRTKNLKVYFTQKKEVIKAVDGVDLFLKKGITTSLAGESGCGKTTLARAILGFYKPDEGEIYFENEDIIKKENITLVRENIQIVFQNPFLSLDPRYTVFSTLYEALSVFRDINKSRAESIIEKALGEVELDKDLMYRYPHQLSGGQLQRVCIARSLINKPPLVILDEPTSSLDVTTAGTIINLLAKLQEKRQITFFYISHNIKLIGKISHFCFIMYRGKIVEYGPKDLVYNNPLHPYTKLLKKAAHQELKSIPQEEMMQLEGCPFYSRCSSRMARCEKEPVSIELEPEHFVCCHLYS
ncbi:MAG: ABC transporter ATP-binding protein [Candidatus Omnitrophota bacterium]|nr:MAG: ABC transporter ATP-binding protein [Candidatus Omnitrophota bacterium]